MIKRVFVDGYKSFKGLEVELEPLSVIIGANSAGKSNFLDAIQLISRAVTSKNLKEAFQEHRGHALESFFYGDEGPKQVFEKDSVIARFEIDVELSGSTIEAVEKTIKEKRQNLESNGVKKEKKRITEKLLRYSLQIEMIPKTGILRVIDESLSALKRNENESKKAFLEKKIHNGREVISLRIEGQAHPQYHELGLDRTVVSEPLYEPHYPHIAAFKKELENWNIYYLEPKKLMRNDQIVSEVEKLGPRGENIAAFIFTMENKEDKKDFRVFNLSLRQILPSIKRIFTENHEGQIGFSIEEESKATYSSRLLSEGTLRIIGLLAALNPNSGSTMIGYEEPENGIHPVRIKQIAELLANTVRLYGKQLIINTHSPVFPGYFPEESLYVCKRAGNTTKIEKFTNSNGPLFKSSAINEALTDNIIRGDYGG